MDDKTARLKKVLTRIACGQARIDGKRLLRETMVNLARETCDAMGWRYDVKTLDGDYE